jgi:hypothetical protein
MQVGDRVIITADEANYPIKGSTATVAMLTNHDHDPKRIGVDIDNWAGGHNLGRDGLSRSGLWVNIHTIRPLKQATLQLIKKHLRDDKVPTDAVCND